MCRVDRTRGEKGFCRAGSETLLSCAVLHGGEEPPVTAAGGSGTLFFAGCTLQCSFCQNHQLSRGMMGSGISDEELARIMVALQEAGAENINFVTASHFIPAIKTASGIARKEGLSIPLLWNTSGYETENSLEILGSFIDVFLPDLKTLNPSLSSRLFRARDYPVYAARAVLKMAEMKKTDFTLIENEGIIRSGVIVRHLVLPGELSSTDEFLKWFAENLMDKAILSLMFQYEPLGSEGEAPLPLRRVSQEEVDAVYEMLDLYEIDDGFIQETDEETQWLPDFENIIPFPGSAKSPVWHWKKGFSAS